MTRWFTFGAGAAAAVAFLVTCGGVPGANGETGDGIYKSGTRIKVKVQNGADGSRAFAALFDSVLESDCFPALFRDGKERCVPALPASLGQTFSDSTCVVDLISAAKVFGRPNFAIRTDSTVFPPRYSDLRRIGRPYVGDVYMVGSSECVKQGSAITSAYSFFLPGEAISDEELVEFTTNTLD